MQISVRCAASLTQVLVLRPDRVAAHAAAAAHGAVDAAAAGGDLPHLRRRLPHRVCRCVVRESACSPAVVVALFTIASLSGSCCTFWCQVQMAAWAAGGNPVLTVCCCRAAASFNLKKMLVVDSGSGLVRVCLANKQHQWDAVPPDPQPGKPSCRRPFDLTRVLTRTIRRIRCLLHSASALALLLLVLLMQSHRPVTSSRVTATRVLIDDAVCSAQQGKLVGSGLIFAVPDPAGARDGMLRWFEEYARRLQEGVYGVSLQPKTHMDLGVPPTLAIDLYPLKPPVRLSRPAWRRIFPDDN